MRRAAAFMLLFLLSLGALGGASAYLTRDACDLRGELLLGDRADAAGVAVRERTVLSGHMAWSAQYSAGDAAVSAQNAWTISDAAAAPSPAPGLGTYSEPFGASWEIRGEEDVPGGTAEEIYAALTDLGAESAVFSLDSFTDSVPLPLTFTNCLDAAAETAMREALAGRFRVPAADGMDVIASCVNHGQYCRFSIRPADSTVMAFRVYADSVYAPDGYLYFTLDAAMDGERPDGSLLPGGGWGIWRVQCTPAPGTDTSAPGWWNEDVRAVPDMATLEAVFTPGQDWDGASLGLSGDGEYVLLTTREADGIWLSVLDAASGARLRRSVLFPAGSGADELPSCSSGPGWAVFRSGDLAAALTQSGPDFTEALRTETGDSALYAPFSRLGGHVLPGAEAGCAYHGGRVWLLRQFTITGESAKDYRRVCVLTAYDSGGMCYAELITDPATSYYGRENHAAELSSAWSLAITGDEEQ